MCNFVGVVLGLHAFLYALLLIPYAKSFIELPYMLFASMQQMPKTTTHVAEVITTPEKEKKKH